MSVLLKRNSVGCRKPGHKIARTTKFRSMAPDISGHSVWNTLRVVLPTPLILRWLLDLRGSLCTTRIKRFLVLMVMIILRYIGVPGISEDE